MVEAASCLTRAAMIALSWRDAQHRKRGSRMRLRHLCAFVLWMLAGIAVGPAAFAAQPAPVLTQANQPFHRGVNVLGYDPYWTDASKRRFEWRHFAEIHKAGFDFVRVVLQAFKHMDAQNRLDPAWLAKLDDVVREAQRAGLGVIIDEHDFDSCSKIGRAHV